MGRRKRTGRKVNYPNGLSSFSCPVEKCRRHRMYRVCIFLYQIFKSTARTSKFVPSQIGIHSVIQWIKCSVITVVLLSWTQMDPVELWSRRPHKEKQVTLRHGDGVCPSTSVLHTGDLSEVNPFGVTRGAPGILLSLTCSTGWWVEVPLVKGLSGVGAVGRIFLP